MSKPAVGVAERDNLEPARPQPTPDRGDLPLTVIKPSHGWVSLGLRNVLRYHELLFFLVWRDVKVRYKQTVVGVLWVVIQPIMTMIIFNFIFGRLAGLPSQGVPYPLFVFAGLIPWQLFATGLNGASNSIVGSANLISKVYFPRLIVPLASVVGGIVDFLCALLVLFGLIVYYGWAFRWTMLALPLFVLLAVTLSFGVGLWLSMLTVQFRDIVYTLPFLTQIWLFMTPVAYASGLIPPKFRLIYHLNPMATVVDGVRWSLLGVRPQFGHTAVASVAIVIAVLVGGLVYFRRAEKTFADVI